MGRDIHITRARDWKQTDGHQISESEWRAVIDADPELSADPENGPNAALWVNHPEGRPDAWLDWSEGNVYTTDACAALLGKMISIAERLQAKVVDDDNQSL